MTLVINNGLAVVTPTLGAGGDTALGLWQAGETKDVPEAAVAGLVTPGSQFSLVDAPDGAQTSAGMAQEAETVS